MSGTYFHYSSYLLATKATCTFQGFRFSYWAFVFADVEQTLRAAGVSGLRPNAPEGFIFPKRVGERMTGAACHTEPQHRPQIMGWFFLGSSRELVDSTTPYKHQGTSPQCSAREACNSQHESCRETPSAPCQDLRSQRMNSVQAEPYGIYAVSASVTSH